MQYINAKLLARLCDIEVMQTLQKETFLNAAKPLEIKMRKPFRNTAVTKWKTDVHPFSISNQ